jgi:HD-like signal output (HDOD) protein
MLEAGEDQESSERELLGITHSELSSAALEGWNLPAPIVDAVRTHHLPSQEPGSVPSLATMLNAADVCVNRLGIPVLVSHPECGKDPAETLAALGLTLDPARFLDEFRAELEVAKSFF